MANLRAGLIGLGMMGRNHARVLRGLSGVDLVGVADPGGDPHKVAGSLDVLPDIESLIKVGIDYCMVAVPTAFHEQVGVALADAGVHALIEKPLAQDTPASQRLADVFEDAGLVGAVGHIERYNPALQEARRRIEAGEIGRVLQIATRRQGPFPARIADVGVVKDLGTHDIDLTQWVAQSPYKRVAAQTAFNSGRKFEDMVLITGQLENGIITNHNVNWLSPLKERVTVISGELGTFMADTLSADLTFWANGKVQSDWSDLAQFRGVTEGDVTRFAFPKREPLVREHENFRDAVLGLEADIVTLAQGRNNVRVAEAAVDSAARGVTIDL